MPRHSGNVGFGDHLEKRGQECGIRPYRRNDGVCGSGSLFRIWRWCVKSTLLEWILGASRYWKLVVTGVLSIAGPPFEQGSKHVTRTCDLDGYQLNGAREELRSEQRNGCDLERLQGGRTARSMLCWRYEYVPCTEVRLRK
jgi:hypothetical protein